MASFGEAKHRPPRFAVKQSKAGSVFLLRLLTQSKAEVIKMLQKKRKAKQAPSDCFGYRRKAKHSKLKSSQSKAKQARLLRQLDANCSTVDCYARTWGHRATYVYRFIPDQDGWESGAKWVSRQPPQKTTSMMIIIC